MSDYTDPRERDPRFPDRPTHPDFDTLSEAVQDMDFRAEKVGEPIPEIVGVDWDSLFYVIRNRLGITGQRMHRDLDEPRWHALYLDAFTLGKVYAETKAKGGVDTWPVGDERIDYVDWQYEVGNGDTVLGFRAWLAARDDTDATEES